MTERTFFGKLFRWICKPDIYEELEGDLQESYRLNRERFGANKARSIYNKEVVKMMRPSVVKKPKIRTQITTNYMFKSYSKTAIRNLLRSRLFSVINIIGLAISMSVGLLVINIIIDQTSFDNFHTRGDRIYRVITESHYMDFGASYLATSPTPLAEGLENFSGIERVVKLRRYFNFDVATDERKLPMEGHYADENFLSVFSFKLQQGNPETALKKPFSLILASKAAKKLFGDGEAVGQNVTVGPYGEFSITGILEDIPRNSHMQFEMLASFSTLPILEAQDKLHKTTTNWFDYTSNYNYLLLNEDMDLGDIENFLLSQSSRYDEDENLRVFFSLQSLAEITPGLDLSNQIGPTFESSVIVAFSILAAVVILSACFNYTNLSIAKALRRLKEIGVRKVMGGKRHQIVIQFLFESVITSLGALLLAFIIMKAIQGQFLEITRDLTQFLAFELNLLVVASFVAFALFVGILAGILPAIYLSATKPASILRDETKIKIFSGIGIRKALIVLQFTISLIFIIVATVANKQFRFAINYDLGFDRQHILNVPLQGNNYQTFINEYSKFPELESISMSSHIVGLGTRNNIWVKFGADSVLSDRLFASGNFIPNHGLQLIAGRTFPEREPGESEHLIIVNEKLLKQLNIGSPLESLEKIITTSRGTEMKIVGVVKDFHYAKLNQPLEGFYLHYYPDAFRQANLKVRSSDMASTMAAFEKTWEGIDGKVHDFEAEFYDNQIDEAYSSYTKAIKVIGFAAVLAISIASMGLLGMAVYSAETKIKEVGIRKVMGADVSNLVSLLSMGFLKLLAIAAVIAVVVTILIFQQLVLPEMAYKAPLGPMEFLIGVGIMLAIGTLTICSQALRAARVSPSESLRSE